MPFPGAQAFPVKAELGWKPLPLLISKHQKAWEGNRMLAFGHTPIHQWLSDALPAPLKGSTPLSRFQLNPKLPPKARSLGLFYGGLLALTFNGFLGFRCGAAVSTHYPQAGLVGLQDSSVGNGQWRAFGCLALEPFLLKFRGQIWVINIFQGFIVLSEDVAGQSEEKNHSIDANDGEDIPGSTGPIWKLQGPGGVGAVPSLQVVPQQVPQDRAGLGLVGGSLVPWETERSRWDPAFWAEVCLARPIPVSLHQWENGTAERGFLCSMGRSLTTYLSIYSF